MERPSPLQFDRAAEALTAIDYPTLRAMLVARAVTQSDARRQPAHMARDVGTMADRIAFFAGRIAAGRRPRGPFVPLAAFVPKGKAAVYLGASASVRNNRVKTLLTPGAAAAAPSGEKP